jgi:hypothetical protein
MTNAIPPDGAVLKLRGHEPKPARLRVEQRPRQTRMTNAILTLVGFFVLAPIVFFIPPHIPWVLLAVSAGVFGAYKQWVGEYLVHEFQGECPRCGASLKIEPGSKIKLPLQLDCYQCHHKPVVALGRSDESP